MLAEAAITLTLSELCEEVGQEVRVGHQSENRTGAFVKAHGIGVCRGVYSSALCEAWKHWDAENASENDPVDIFTETQLYVVRIACMILRMYSFFLASEESVCHVVCRSSLWQTEDVI